MERTVGAATEAPLQYVPRKIFISDGYAAKVVV